MHTVALPGLSFKFRLLLSKSGEKPVFLKSYEGELLVQGPHS